MMGTESISQEERTDLQTGRDMLSELPLGIIHTILAFVPIKEAIRTSILSRQWRYTWTSLPHLVFRDDCTFGEYYNFSEDIEDCLESFITHVLFLHKGPVHKVELSVPFKSKCLNIGAWLLCLSRKDLRELIVDPQSSEMQRLHSSIYSCKKLTKLELFSCQLDPPPATFKAFLFLRCLFLYRVLLSTNEAESLVANCPLLEELKLINCSLTELRITAPNLKVLFLMDGYIELSVYAPLLAELTVDLGNDGFIDKHQQRNCSACNYTDFIGGFTNLEKLCGDSFFPMYLSMGIESCHHTLVFHRLKDINLAGVDVEDIKEISVVARLILGAPNLEKLRLAPISRSLEDHDALKARHVPFSDFGCAPDFKLEKLSFVKMMCTTALPPQMALIRFLLERSPVLETMFLMAPSSTEKQKVSAELDECKRASPNVKLTVTQFGSLRIRA